MNPRDRSARAVVVVAASVLLPFALVSGCSAEPAPPAPLPAQATSTPPKATFAQPAGAFRELDDIVCKQRKGRWSFSATLHNGGRSKATYVVEVAVTTAEGGTVLGQTKIAKELTPGKTAKLSAASFYRSKASGLVCVPSATKS